MLYFSGWGERFMTWFATKARAHGAVPMIDMNPYGVSMRSIAAGRSDGYLRSYALAVRSYGDPVVISFTSLFGPTIAAIRDVTHKPLLLAETAVGPLAGQAAKIPNLFAGVGADHLLGFVWFDKAQNNGLYHQNWRIDGVPAALAAFRRAARHYR